MNRKEVFNIGVHIWFVLHLNEKNEIVWLEEHDYREGGGIKLPEGREYEEYFIEQVLSRVTTNSQEEYKKKAEEFLIEIKNK